MIATPFRVSLSLFVFACVCASAQDAASNPTAAAEAKQGLTRVMNNIVKAAEKVPEEDYSFRATPEVRPFGQLIAHVADSQMRACSMLNGSPKPPAAGSKTSESRPRRRPPGLRRRMRQSRRLGHRRQRRRVHRQRLHAPLAFRHALLRHRPRQRNVRNHVRLHAPQRHRPAIKRTAKITAPPRLRRHFHVIHRRSGLRQWLAHFPHRLEVRSERVLEIPPGLVFRVARGGASRHIGRVRRESRPRPFDHHGKSFSNHFKPAFLSIAFNVPGASSLPSFPGTVMTKCLSGCLNCRWLPLDRVSFQPSLNSSWMTSRTLIGMRRS